MCCHSCCPAAMPSLHVRYRRGLGEGNHTFLSLDNGERRVLITGGSDARYVATGHLLYMKSGTLMAVPFNARSQQVSGTPVAID